MITRSEKILTEALKNHKNSLFIQCIVEVGAQRPDTGMQINIFVIIVVMLYKVMNARVVKSAGLNPTNTRRYCRTMEALAK